MHFLNEASEFSDEFHDDGTPREGDDMPNDEMRCQACSERVLKVATKAMDNGDVFCLECASEVGA